MECLFVYSLNFTDVTGSINIKTLKTLFQVIISCKLCAIVLLTLSFYSNSVLIGVCVRTDRFSSSFCYWFFNYLIHSIFLIYMWFFPRCMAIRTTLCFPLIWSVTDDLAQTYPSNSFNAEEGCKSRGDGFISGILRDSHVVYGCKEHCLPFFMQLLVIIFCSRK